MQTHALNYNPLEMGFKETGVERAQAWQGVFHSVSVEGGLDSLCKWVVEG